MRLSLLLLVVASIHLFAECRSHHKRHSTGKKHSRDESRSKLHKLKKKQAPAPPPTTAAPEAQAPQTTAQAQQQAAPDQTPPTQPGQASGQPPTQPEAGAQQTTTESTVAPVVVYASTEGPDESGSGSGYEQPIESTGSTTASVPPPEEATVSTTLPIPTGPSLTSVPPQPMAENPQVTAAPQYLPPNMDTSQLANQQSQSIMQQTMSPVGSNQYPPTPAPLVVRHKTSYSGKHQAHSSRKQTDAARKSYAAASHHSKHHNLHVAKKNSHALKKGVVTTHTVNRISQSPKASLTQHANSDTSSVVRLNTGNKSSK